MPSPGFATDFTYRYFVKLIEAVQERFEPRVFSQLPETLRNETSAVFLLRHDVDVSLERAIEMARLEREHEMPATYMILTRASLYQIDTTAAREKLREIRRHGHEIGLHFDVANWSSDGVLLPEALKSAIAADCSKLEEALGERVPSFSFHRPLQSLLGGNLEISGRVNAYARDAMKGYMSDSKGSWRDGEPLPKIINSPHRILQVLIHPIWWGTEHMAGADRLEAFFRAETRRKSPGDRDCFDQMLAQSVPAVRRAGYPG